MESCESNMSGEYIKHKFTTLQAYHNDANLKAKCVRAVQKLDKRYVYMPRSENGTASFMDCVYPDGFEKTETKYGLPAWLINLADTVFYGLPNKEANKFANEFLEVIPLGANLDKAYFDFCARVLQYALFEHEGFVYHREVSTAVGNAVRLMQRMQAGKIDVHLTEWENVHTRARSAAEEAETLYNISNRHNRLSAEAAKIAAEATAYNRISNKSVRVAEIIAEKTAEMVRAMNDPAETNMPRDSDYKKIAEILIAVLQDAESD